MKNFSILLLVILMICACAKKNGPRQLERPQFRVTVTLTDKAESKLKTQNETVKVVAYFFGQPDDSLAAKLATNEHGQIGIGKSEVELNGSGIADFSKVEFSPTRINLLASADYEVLINVMSGRRSDKNNLLECGTAGGKLSTIQRKALDVHCKLVWD